MNIDQKEILSKTEINTLINEVVDEIYNKINEAEPVSTQPIRPNTQNVQQPKVAPKPKMTPSVVKKPPVVQKKSAPVKNSSPNVKPSGISNTPNQYNPEMAKKKQTMTKVQYQIFNIKLRTNKLELNDAVRRFIQSMHDFDINVTKNSTDSNEIQSYLFPVQGNLVALKGALESLESEFNELQKLLETENK